MSGIRISSLSPTSLPCQPDDLYNNAIDGDDWSNVAAVKNQQVYKFPLGYVPLVPARI